MRNILPVIIMTVFLLPSCRDAESERIRTAVEKQLETYPQSTLQDLYKNFFQDCFGPGHIVSDTASAGAYLDSELALSVPFSGACYEPTGHNGRFYRVNLSVIRDGLVSRDAFFDAFLRSVVDIPPVSIEEWKRDWGKIDAVIRTMHLPLAGYERDRAGIASLLEQGRYAMHHSEPFTEAYDPHYRIISREIFLKEIRPHLP
ncbi:MAG: hypothetical protein LBJ47_07850 [Tannerella sp.]|nr:hypothetical protein [Tannerella sp.]